MIGKHWNNQYCYNCLILENSIKITKVRSDEKQIKVGYMNDAMITLPLNTKLFFMRKLD